MNTARHPSAAARLLLTLIAAIVALALPAPTAAAQTTITLRAVAQAGDPARALTLGDVAEIAGEDAARWMALPLGDAAAPGGDGAVTIVQARAALDRAGANWGRITLRGSSCRIGAASASAPAFAATPASKRPEQLSVVVDVAGQLTVRKAAAKRLAAHFSVESADLQLAFDAKVTPALDSAVADHHRVEVQPGASASSSRVPVRATVYAGDRVVADHRFTVDVLVRREVLVAQRAIERREAIAESDLRSERRWVAPGAERGVSASAAQAVGSVARTRIKEGDVIAASDLDSPVIIKRGDVVYVHCLSGSMVVQAKARALASGREGDIIAFRMEGAEDSFSARIAGRGRAVMVADEWHGHPAREVDQEGAPSASSGWLKPARMEAR